jgi:hypothetical protein
MQRCERLNVAADRVDLHQAVTRSEQIHRALWAQAESLAALDRSSEVYALFTSSLNNVIDLHYKRVTVLLLTSFSRLSCGSSISSHSSR